MKTYIKPMVLGVVLVSSLAFGSSAHALSSVSLDTLNHVTPVTSATVVPLSTTKNIPVTNPKKLTGLSLSEIIAKGDTAIAKRIESLNKLSTKVMGMKFLSDAQKAAGQSTINTAIAGMNAAKAKLDADTDVAQAELDYKAIFQDNRIYMVVIPQVRIAARANNILAALPNVNTNLGKIQTRITAASTAGQDVTAIQAQYADVQAKITDANTQATNAITLAGTLQIDHGDAAIKAANKTIDTNIKTALSALKADLTTVRNDIKAMNTALTALGF